MERYTKFLIAGNILLFVLLAWLLIKENYPSRIYHALTDPENPADTKRAYSFNRDQLFEALPKNTSAIVFLGNSLTEHYEVSEFFHNADIKNRGISGDVTEGVLQRLQPIIHSQPKKIFIEIGINDVFKEIPDDLILRNYDTLLLRLITQCPRAKIYVQSLFPVSNDKEMLPNYNTIKINKTIQEINSRLKLLVNEKQAAFPSSQVMYIDTHSKFQLNDGLNKDYTIDGVHFSAKGYLLWTKILKPFVEE